MPERHEIPAQELSIAGMRLFVPALALTIVDTVQDTESGTTLVSWSLGLAHA